LASVSAISGVAGAYLSAKYWSCGWLGDISIDDISTADVTSTGAEGEAMVNVESAQDWVQRVEEKVSLLADAAARDLELNWYSS
jgi:hypothetical protein